MSIGRDAALTELRVLAESGLRDHTIAWNLTVQATKSLPQDYRIDALRTNVVDLLQAIEIETILGGDCNTYRRQLTLLLDWIERQSEAGLQKKGQHKK
ncbi:hypothetical protein [Neoaquamicrobium sediminum]|uniref:hypothetical protein n=1 Tax=Neoaquamicrobium sediminum TaxID=1849104 RepID=UPI001563BB91|nr:hypothetical protein [Mesorhizobium sediminum]NRC56216.1 hypothetical protein [Mesorhizobium sediminum]